MFVAYLYKMVMFVLLLSFVGCNSSSVVQDENTTFDANLSMQFKQALDTSLIDNNVTGAVLAVRSPDGATLKIASGYSIEETQTEMTTDLSFRIGSITKTLTAEMMLMLVDEGVVSLDTTIDEILPELHIVMGDQITIRYLLEMRSGLEKYLANPDFIQYLIYDPGHIWDPEDIVQYSNIKVSEPGTEFLYNNGNYVLLGLMIEKLTSMDYDAAIKEYILDPLSMKSTYLPTNLNVPDLFADGYVYDSDVNMTINQTYYLNPTIAWSSGGFISNADDLLTWVEVYTNGDLISDDLYEEQFNLISTEGANPYIDSYGLGVLQYNYLIGHDGYIPPYSSWIATYKGYKFVLLTNGTKGVEDPSMAATYMLMDIIDSVDSQL